MGRVDISHDCRPEFPRLEKTGATNKGHTTMYEDSLELECTVCVDCDAPYPCAYGGNVGMPNVDPRHANTGVRYAMSKEQARLYNAAYWKHGLALILMRDGSYELFDSLA